MIGSFLRKAQLTGAAGAPPPPPSWSLDFSSGSPWANGTDYTYSSLRTAGTYVDSSGYIALNAANRWTNSEVIASWPTVTTSNCNTAANSTAAPDGTTTADTVSATTTNASHFVRGQAAGTSAISGANHTWSVYLKAGGGVGATYGLIAVESSGTPDRTTRVIYDLTTGARTQELSSNSPTGVESPAQAENCGNGWWRVWIRQDINGTSHQRCFVGLTNVSTSASVYPAFAGAASDADFIYVWGAQYVIGSAPLPYSATTTAANGIPRLMHNSSGSRLGLLVEGGATNLCLQSADLTTTWTNQDTTEGSNVITAPDGNVSADSMIDMATTGPHGIFQVILSQSTTATYTISAFLKKGTVRYVGLLNWMSGANHFGVVVDMDNPTQANLVTGAIGTGTSVSGATITPVGNGWYRVSVTGIGNQAGHYPSIVHRSTAYNGTGAITESYAGSTANFTYVWGFQYEQQAFASSYIPTTTATVARAAETVHVPDSKIPSWGDGALVVHFYPPSQAGTILSTDDAATAQVGIEADTATDVRAFWSSGTTASETMTTGLQKAAHYWKGSASKFCLNGGPVRSGGNNLVIGNTDFVTLGAEATDSAGVPGTFSKYSNCIIRKVEFYPGDLTDSNLQAITT